jgi:hypothetical protein
MIPDCCSYGNLWHGAVIMTMIWTLTFLCGSYTNSLSATRLGCCVESFLLSQRVGNTAPTSASRKDGMMKCLIEKKDSVWKQYVDAGSTEWSKSDTTYSWRMFYLSTNKLQWNQKTKNNVIFVCWKCSPRSAIHAFTIFVVFGAIRWRVPVSRKRFTRRDTVDLFGTGESGNVSLNSFWQVK